MAHNLITDRLKVSFQLYDDLIQFLPEDFLTQRLGDLPSNEIGHQLWCVVGARASYLDALKAGSWQGFRCPLAADDTGVIDAVQRALTSTAEDLVSYLTSSTGYPESLAVELLEHEVQHHGQLIRYLYGLKLGVPRSWKLRYNLD